MAAILTAILCLPAVWQTVAYPSVSDVWCYGMVAMLSIPAFCASLRARQWPRPHALDAIVLLWALYMACNYWLLSPYPATEDFHEAEALCLAYAALRLAIPFCGKAFGAVWTTGLCLAGLYQIYTGIAQLAGWEPSHHYRYALTGTFFNPGPYAILVAIALTVAAAWLYNHKGAWTGLSRPDKIFRVTVYAMWVTGLPVLAATWIRTAWVALAVALTVMLWRGHRRMVLGGLAVAACLGVCAYAMKQNSADGRLLMTIVAGKAWTAEWLTGHGLGGFAHAYGKAQAAFFTGHPDSPLLSVAGSPEYAFNGLAGVSVEQGFIGMACALTITSWTAFILVRKREASACGYIALLVASMFSYPFSLWPFRLWATGWVAYAVSLQAGTGTGAAWWKKASGAAMAILLAVPSVWWTAETKTRVEAYGEYRALSGIQDAAFVDDFRKNYDRLKDRPEYLFTYGKALRELERYNDSNAALRQGTRVSCDPMFHVMMGNNYLDLGAPREAETAYRKAFSLLPNRVYPLYRLMKLYEATGKNEKARDMARRITAFRAKVDSPAVRKMKEEAEDLLQQTHVQKPQRKNEAL
jgi:hypothetical protein